MSRYAKALVALLGALSTWGITAAEDGAYSQVELWGALLAAVTALGVYAWPNRPPDGVADPGMSEQDPQGGYGEVDTVTLVLAVLAIVVLLLIVL